MTAGQRGLLIAFEGGDGSGKTTQAKLLAKRLDAVLTQQAGGTEFGQRLRAIALSPEAAGLSLKAEALLFMTDRAEHVAKVVAPALTSGHSVVSDRWAYSSMAYQGYARGLNLDELRHISDWAMDGLWPDIVVFIDVPLEVGAQRQATRHGDQDHYELAGSDFQRLLVNGYRQMAADEPERWITVDGQGGVEEVEQRVWAAISPRLERAKLHS